MHTEAAHEFVVHGLDDRIFVCRLHRLRRDRVIIGQIVLLRTGAFTLFAADAHGRVIQQCFTHRNCSLLLPARIFFQGA